MPVSVFFSVPKSRIPSNFSRARPALALALALTLGAALGCNGPVAQTIAAYREPEPEPARPIAPRETVSYEFPADGELHRSPYLALNGQHLRILPDATSAGLVKDNAIRMMVEEDEIMIGNHQVLRMQTPGPMWFKIDEKSRRKWISTLTVTIECVD